MNDIDKESIIARFDENEDHNKIYNYYCFIYYDFCLYIIVFIYIMILIILIIINHIYDYYFNNRNHFIHDNYKISDNSKKVDILKLMNTLIYHKNFKVCKLTKEMIDVCFFNIRVGNYFMIIQIDNHLNIVINF